MEGRHNKWWQKHKEKVGLVGGIALGWAMAHVGVIVGGVAVTITGIIGAVVIGGGICRV